MEDELDRLRRDFAWDISEHANHKSGVWKSTIESRDVDYPEESYALCRGVEDRSFWFAHRNHLILDTLNAVNRPASLWEIGSGNGFVSKAIDAAGIPVVAVEPGALGAQAAADRGIKISVCAFFEQLKLPADSIPAVGCFDVLEHMEEPKALIRQFYRTLAPGGILLITVPALSWLWSQNDEFARHHRRYSITSLNSLVTCEGFLPLRVNYCFFSMVPLVYFFRALPWRLGRQFAGPELVERGISQLAPETGAGLFRVVLAMERKVSRWIKLPLGTSIIGAYRKT